MDQHPEKILAKGNEAIAMGAMDAGCRSLTSAIPSPRRAIFPNISPEHSLARRGVHPGRERDCFHQPAPGGIGDRSEGHDLFLQSGNLPHAGRDLLHGRQRTSVPDREYFTKRTRSRGHFGIPGRLFSGHEGRRAWRLPGDRAGTSTVQEMYDLTCLAFDLSDKYRNPAMILGDALLGQMKEPLLRGGYQKMELPPKDWALTGAQGRTP